MLQKVSLETFVQCSQAFIKRMMGRCFVEAYATGNFSAEQASHLAATIESLLKVTDQQASLAMPLPHVRHCRD